VNADGNVYILLFCSSPEFHFYLSGPHFAHTATFSPCKVLESLILFGQITHIKCTSISILVSLLSRNNQPNFNTYSWELRLGVVLKLVHEAVIKSLNKLIAFYLINNVILEKRKRGITCGLQIFQEKYVTAKMCFCYQYFEIEKYFNAEITIWELRCLCIVPANTSMLKSHKIAITKVDSGAEQFTVDTSHQLICLYFFIDFV